MNRIAKLLSIAGFLVFSHYPGTVFSAGGGAVLSDPNAMKGEHFHPQGKMPSQHTVRLQNRQRQTLPFSDKRDFDEARRRFIAAPPYKQIMADAGQVA